MNKTVKRIFLASMICGLSGILLFGGVYLTTGKSSIILNETGKDFLTQLFDGDLAYIFEAEKSTQTPIEFQKTYENIEEIVLECDICEIEIIGEQRLDYALSVQYDPSFELKEELRENNLSLRLSSDHSHYYDVSNTLILKVPMNSEFTNSAFINHLGNNNIRNVKLKDSSYQANLGDIDFEDVTLDNTEVKLNLGDLDWDGILLNHVDITNDMGDVSIECQQKESEVAYSLSASLGDVKVHEEKVENSYASINDAAVHFLNVESSMGDIELEFKK